MLTVLAWSVATTVIFSALFVLVPMLRAWRVRRARRRERDKLTRLSHQYSRSR